MADPQTPPLSEDVDDVARACRRFVNQRALVAAGVAVVPVPGLDWLADVGLLMRVIPEINRRFGLSQEQIERLAPDRRIAVYKALTAAGSLLAGRLVTRTLLVQSLRVVGVRLSAQQVAKFVPIAGQALSAVLTFGALRFVCEQHIRQCMAVRRSLMLSDGRSAGSR